MQPPVSKTIFCELSRFHQSSKKPKCCLGGSQILANQTILFCFLTIKLSYFLNMSGYNYGEINDFGRLVQFVACYDGTIIFYPVHLTLFTSISMKMSNVSGVLIQILMTCFFDLVTGNSLKR